MKSKFIDYAKGVSILTIVLYHFLCQVDLPKLISYAVNFGGAGVHLFFFVSGFGLTKSSYSTYFNFLKRRLNKVLIPYYITITLIFLTNLFAHIYPHGLKEYLSHILLYKMFVPKYEETFGIQFWFVSTIIQFYLVFPLLLLALKSKKSHILLPLFVIISLTYSLLISISPFSTERVFNGFFLQYLWEFVLGMLIAQKNILDRLISKPIYYYLVAAVINIGITGLLAIKGGQTGKNFNDIFSFAAYTSVVIILYRIGDKYLPIANKYILLISAFSYSLYLTHMIIWDSLNIDNIRLVIPIFALSLIIAYYYDMLLKAITNKKDVNVYQNLNTKIKT